MASHKWIHCNYCLRLKDNQLQFYLLSCKHVICHNCREVNGELNKFMHEKFYMTTKPGWRFISFSICLSNDFRHLLL